MAPYTCPNDTLAPSKVALSRPSYDLLPRRSFETTILFNSSTPTTLPHVAHEEIANALPHVGIGPVLLQPSSSHAIDAKATSYSTHHETSPRLGYIAIIAIPIVAILVLFLLIRRRKQNPAKRAVPPGHTLRSEAARARVDTQQPRVQQLPRDRIRAMNSVPRDQETPSAPPPYHQIFSPRLASPPLNEHPRTLGHSFVSLSVPGYVEPPSPLTSVSTFATNLDSLPPTPCSPNFAISDELSSRAEACFEAQNEDESEEGRFTWDFKCKGMTDRLSRASVVSTEDAIQQKNASPSVEGSSPDFGKQDRLPQEDVHVQGGAESQPASLPLTIPDHVVEKILQPALHSDLQVTVDTLCSQDRSAINPSDLSSSIPVKSVTSSSMAAVTGFSLPEPNVVDSGAQKSLTKSDTNVSGLTVLDLDLGDMSFSAQVINALASTPSCKFRQEQVSETRPVPLSPKIMEAGTSEQVSEEQAKKRPVLSKPNHRNLTPTTSNLRVQAQGSVDVVLSISCLASSAVFQAPLEQLNGMAAGTRCRLTVLSRTGMGRNRSSSDTALRTLRKSCLSSTSLCGTPTVLDFKSPEFSAATSDKTTTSKIVEPVPVKSFERTALRSSLSMPLAVELAWLSSITRQINTDNDLFA